jgi:hypothetical protein
MMEHLNANKKSSLDNCDDPITIACTKNHINKLSFVEKIVLFNAQPPYYLIGI